jgi:hypothetical protein
MAFVTAADIASYVQTIFEDAQMVARDNNLMTGLVTTFSASGTASRSRSEYGTATINQIGETDDLASQAFTPSVQNTLTPYEYGAQFFLTDTRIESDPFAIRSEASMELGSALGQSVETNILGNFSSFTGGTVGAAGSALSWGYFYAMMSRLRAQNAPMPYYFVCHPHQWHALGKAASVAGTMTNAAPELLSGINTNFYVGSVSGVMIFTSSNIAVDGSDDAIAGMFSRQALAFDVRRAMRLEPERDSSRRGWELNLTMLYAHGVWRPKFGIQGTFDAAAPTS